MIRKEFSLENSSFVSNLVSIHNQDFAFLTDNILYKIENRKKLVDVFHLPDGAMAIGQGTCAETESITPPSAFPSLLSAPVMVNDICVVGYRFPKKAATTLVGFDNSFQQVFQCEYPQINGAKLFVTANGVLYMLHRGAQLKDYLVSKLNLDGTITWTKEIGSIVSTCIFPLNCSILFASKYQGKHVLLQVFEDGNIKVLLPLETYYTKHEHPLCLRAREPYITFQNGKGLFYYPSNSEVVYHFSITDEDRTFRYQKIQVEQADDPYFAKSVFFEPYIEEGVFVCWGNYSQEFLNSELLLLREENGKFIREKQLFTGRAVISLYPPKVYKDGKIAFLEQPLNEKNQVRLSDGKSKIGSRMTEYGENFGFVDDCIYTISSGNSKRKLELFWRKKAQINDTI